MYPSEAAANGKESQRGKGRVSRPGKSKRVLEWLLEDDQPSVRYLALTQLLGKSEDDPEVQVAKKMIPKKGWAAEILAKQDRGGWWVSEESLYRPKYLSRTGCSSSFPTWD